MDANLNHFYWGHQIQLMPSLEDMPQGCVWVPCFPDFENNSYVPIYNLQNNLVSSKVDSKIYLDKKPRISRGGIKTKPWKESEDNLLKELVSLHGLKKWAFISQDINDKLHKGSEVRKGKHCRERWHNHLDPELNSKIYVEGE